MKTYTDQALGFSFEYPDNLTVAQPADAEDSGGALIIIQGTDGKSGFQVAVDPFDEKTELSLETIKKSAGALVVENAKEIIVGKNSDIKAFSFTLKTPSTGSNDDSSALQEVWFVRNGKLYQISNYPDFAGSMGKILGSLNFN